jgi:opacity protein-like surface antigen|tara:strand:- start:68868 stop:69602 length:735 start_codon:yes stop_codon:yes gene_type:complete
MKSTLQISALVVFTLIATASFAQSLNFSGGYTSTTIKGAGFGTESSSQSGSGGGSSYTGFTKNKNLSGFNVSIGYEFRLGERLSLETGFKYQTRGTRMISEYSYNDPFSSYSEKGNLKYRLNYLDLPIVLNTAILTGDFRLYARTGIYVGFLTSGKFSERLEYTSSYGENGVSEYNEALDFSTGDAGDRFSGGIILGVGAEYKGFFVETNFIKGFFSFSSLDDKIYTRDLTFSLGYKLKFNKGK